MKVLLLLSFGHAAVASVIGGVSQRSEVESDCGTPETHYEPNSLVKRANPPADDDKEIVFDLLMHLCCRKEECPTDEGVRTLVDGANKLMAKANIRLNLKNVDHRDDPRCHGALDNLPILDVLRPEFRQGGLSTLNMITIPKDPAVPGVRGICSLPSPGDDLTVDSMLKQDVCAIAALGKNYATMIPTFAHEVFHWLGLNHVPFRSFVPGGKDNLMVAGTNVISIHTLSEEQRRVARQWGHIRQNGQKNGFGITHDVADPPPTDVGGTYAPGSGPMPDPEAGNGSPGEGNNELGTGGPPAKATCGDAGNGGRPPDGSYLGYGNAAGFAGNTLGDGGLPGDAPPAAAPGDEQQDVSRQGGQYRRFK